jgi:hypothetical protein
MVCLPCQCRFSRCLAEIQSRVYINRLTKFHSSRSLVLRQKGMLSCDPEYHPKAIPTDKPPYGE